MSSAGSPQPSAQAETASNNDLCNIARLKRQLAASQEEVKELMHGKVKRPATVVTLGRGIRRLVCLHESLDDLLRAADREGEEDAEESKDDALLTPEVLERRREDIRESDSKVTAFKILLQTFPAIKRAMEDPNTELDMYLAQLQKGANDARSDDMKRIKEEVPIWLNADYAPNPLLEMKTRNGRGRYNNVTAHLLCPIEYDWDDEAIRNGIRNATINISEDYFLRCFYPNGRGDPNNVEKGFLRSGLLVKTYSTVFVSPSSSDCFHDSEDGNGAERKKQRNNDSQKKATKVNVASLLGMEGRVTARSIAYAAVLLAFNLTDAVQWMEVYNHFDYRALYAMIVEFLEEPGGRAAKARVDELLQWWSEKIFPHHVGVSASTRKSRNKLAAQRAAREESVEI